MGKKHKKHKSEKHAYEDYGERPLKPDYGERPLKLVLKVAGTEVTAGSSSRERFYEEQQGDYDKVPKDKKKKKKKREDKDRSSPGSPMDDKRRKKMTKKRKGQDSADTDWDDREQSRTPAPSQLCSSLAKREEKEQTPLQEALSQLVRQLQRKDPSGFFCFPVTDLIAPGYSSVIRRPMDFSTMKDKVRTEQYQTLDELKVDLRIMCENAMIYNKPETIYHKAARKLLHSGMKILSPERLESLRQSIEFMADLANPASQAGKTEEEEGGGGGVDHPKHAALPTDPSDNSQSPCPPSQDRDSKEDMSKAISLAQKELEDIRRVIEESGGKLSNRELTSELEFVRRKADGSTTLAFLNPADLTAGDMGYCPVKLGMMSGRLQSGVNTLQGFREDKRNLITPVCYINYGPFTSFAPTYDSSFANISKEDTDLIYSTYGEDSSLQASESVSDFLVRSEEHVYRLADDLLDALTNGEHSKTIRENQTSAVGGEAPAKVTESGADKTEVSEPEGRRRLASLSSVIGLDLLAEEEEDLSEEARVFQRKLDETTRLLRELQDAQRERLSTRQPPNTITLHPPTAREIQLAERVTGNLAGLASQVGPGDVSSVWGIRKAMGISTLTPPEPDTTLVHLTTVEETSMDTSPVGPEAPSVITV